MKKTICFVIAFSLLIVSSINYLYAISIENQDNVVTERQDVIAEAEENGGEKNDNDQNIDDNQELVDDEEKKESETDKNINNENQDNEINDNNSNNNLLENTDIISEQLTGNPELLYSSYVQEYGWMGYVAEGQFSGTEGKFKRLEGIKIKINNSVNGGVSYSTHIQDVGWTDYCNDDEVSGTTNRGLRLEAIKIKLTGELANSYDIYYRVHVQDFGWLGWANNGNSSGSQSYSKQVEAIQIKLVEKGGSAPGDTDTPFKSPGKVYYSTHVEEYGWNGWIGDGKTSGTIGKGKRLEAIRIGISNLPYSGNIEYSAHIENIGWQDYKNEEGVAGTVGRALKIEAIKIRLTGEVASYYDIYYRVHVQDFGWLGWASNGNSAGTEGFSLRAEAIEIIIVEKGASAPGTTTNPYLSMGNINYSSHIEKRGWTSDVSNGAISGTVGQALQMEAIKISLGDNSYNGNIEYTTHVQDIGWLNYVRNGEVSGTVGQAKQIEAIKIRLTGDIENYYDVYYRVQCQDIGWLDWAYNDSIAGTVGGAYQIETIQVRLYPKNIEKPGFSNRSSLTFLQKNGFNVCVDANGKLHEDAQSILGLRGSYALRVNKSTNVVTVLIQNGNGVYNVAYKRFVCSVGNATPIGTFYTPIKYRWKELIGPSYGQFSTRIVGGILFHSVPYNKMNNRTLSARMYNQLGTTCSHGCVRLTCADAKWIYDNCPLRTRVDITWGIDPLSKPSAQKLPLTQTWDPTDPTL